MNGSRSLPSNDMALQLQLCDIRFDPLIKNENEQLPTKFGC